MEHVSREEFDQFVTYIERKFMALQDDINALVAQVGTVSTDLATGITAVQTELNNLAAQGGTVDLSALQAAVADLDTQVQTLATLAPQQPAPPAPADPTQPVYTFAGDPSTIDATQWVASGFETAPTDGSAPVVLYYFAGDAANSGVTSAGTGADGVNWVQYTGAYQVVPQS